MKLKVTDDKKFLLITEGTSLEIEQIQHSFTKKVMNWGAIRDKTNGRPKFFETSFIDKWLRMPIGLWRELQKLSKKYMFTVEIDGIEHLYDKDYDESLFIEWVNTYFENSDRQPRDYQIEGISRILKYKNCVEEISTSGGKTLMAFMLFRYLLDKGIINKMLYVVPNVSLVTQTEEEFYQYEEMCDKKPVWKSQCVYGGHGKDEKMDSNIVIGTFQSLSKKDLPYFSKFDVVFIDECLHPDTLILMHDLTKKKIKDINVGDRVWTINEKDDILEVKDVQKVFKNLSKNKQLYKIQMIDGSVIKITENHKILTKNNIWKLANELTIQDEIVNINKLNILETLKIKKITKKKYKGNVYDLKINSDTEYNHNYFANGLCVSNCHHAKAKSIRDVIVKSYNSKFNIGVSGTLPPDDSLDSFNIQSYLGPCVYIVKSADLISSNFATPVNIIGIRMDYLDEEQKKRLYNLRIVPTEQKDGVKLLNLEKDIVRENRKRLVYVCNTISKSTKNSLVLFSDIKNDYGKNVYNYLKENTNKTVYYIDGGTKGESRDYYKKQMEESEDIIIVASIGTFSEGISINNCHNIFIIESSKSEYQVRQMLGRGMRLLEGKEMMTVIDFQDNFIYGSHKYQRVNYLMRHAYERERIYKDKKFPYKFYNVKF